MRQCNLNIGEQKGFEQIKNVKLNIAETSLLGHLTETMQH